jgi:uncharacterized protein YbaR (Trm112 family)
MKPTYTSPGADMLACPACDTNVLGSPQPVALQVHQAQGLRLMRLGDVSVVLDGSLAQQWQALLDAGDYDLAPEAAMQLSGTMVCPACGHHSDWQLQRRPEDYLYSRYRLQLLDPQEAPKNGQAFLTQDLHAAQPLLLTLEPVATPKDLSQAHSLELLFTLLEVHTLRYLVTARSPLGQPLFAAQALVPLPPQH